MRVPLCALRVTAFLAALAALEGIAATLVVSNTSASGPGSLQQAILDANATSGLDTIVFQIPGSGVRTIAPTNALPPITDPVVIDGTTQPGFGGALLIELNGASAGANSDGFRLSAGGSTIRGLVINRFSGAGLHLQAPGGTNIIQGNFIGTDPTGTTSRGNGQSPLQSGGVWIDGSSGNWIGGADPTNRNLISGNSGPGVYLQNVPAISFRATSSARPCRGLPRWAIATTASAFYNASGNQIGGSLPAARNIISGNGGSGLFLSGSRSQPGAGQLHWHGH